MSHDSSVLAIKETTRLFRILFFFQKKTGKFQIYINIYIYIYVSVYIFVYKTISGIENMCQKKYIFIYMCITETTRQVLLARRRKGVDLSNWEREKKNLVCQLRFVSDARASWIMVNTFLIRRPGLYVFRIRIFPQ